MRCPTNTKTSATSTKKRHADELNDLVRTLIDVQVHGNELLAALNRKIDTTICVLEHISRNTCETLNKLHEFAECKETEACDPCRPAEICCAKPPAPPPTKSEPPCKYEPCKPGEEGAGSDVAQPGSAPPNARSARRILLRRPRPAPAGRTASPRPKFRGGRFAAF